MAFGVYGFFSKKEVYYPVTSNNSAYTPFMLRPYIPPRKVIVVTKPVYIDTSAAGRAAATEKTITDSNARANAKTISDNKKKHKRKKFLGIF